MKTLNKMFAKNFPILAVVTLLVAVPAFAGADTTFGGIYTTVSGWLAGSLGKLLAGVFVIIGLVAGAARQSLLAFAVGIGAAVGVANINAILGNIVTATLEHAPNATQAVLSVTNGLV